jgi:hypothetical protein
MVGSNWNIMCGEDYFFQVSSVNDEGLESELSQPVFFFTFPCHLQGQVAKPLRVGAFLVKFPDAHAEPDPWTVEEYEAFIEEIGAFFAEMSWGRMQFKVEAFDWVDVPIHFGEYWNRQEYMDAVFQLVGVDPDDYDRYFFVSRGVRLFADPRNCAIASGRSTHMCSLSWGTTLEEIGHTLGLGHAGRIFCRESGSPRPSSYIGPNLDQLNEDDGDLACSNHGLDPLDPMGSGSDGFNVWNRRQMGFLLPGQVETAKLSEIGSRHVLLALEAPNPRPAFRTSHNRRSDLPVRMVRIPLGQWSAHLKTFYFLEYRMPLGMRPVERGVRIYLAQGDQNPGGWSNHPHAIWMNRPILEGNDFYDRYRNIRVSMMESEGHQATIRVSTDRGKKGQR